MPLPVSALALLQLMQMVGKIPVVEKVCVDSGGVSERQSPLISMRMDE